MRDFSRILLLFIFWRVSLFLFASMASLLIPEFGARFPYYRQLIASGLPEYIWAFGNFDGVHYLRIAGTGYESEYSQAFFPFYPFLIKVFSLLMPFNLEANLLISGLLISNICALFAVFLIYELFKLDFSDKISFKAVLLLLSFPTAFYLGAVYTESLFLLLTGLAFILMRKEKFILSALVVGLSTATRVFGILLIPVLLYYLYKTKQGVLKTLFLLGLSVWGIAAYMVYLGTNFGDPFYFLNAQPAFGAERTSQTVVLLPQVIYRYFKMFMTVDIKTIVFLNAFIEFIFVIIPLLVVFFSRKSIKKEYTFFSLASLIMPTLTGTFSSMPRYSLMIFPAFPFVVMKLKRLFYPLCLLLFLLQFILMVMFIRGYWIA